MQLLTAIMNLEPAQLFIGAAFVFVAICMAGGSTPSLEEDDDYENASWNPASVNYNG